MTVPKLLDITSAPFEDTVKIETNVIGHEQIEDFLEFWAVTFRKMQILSILMLRNFIEKK
jgi:hypothetical protein